MALIAREPHSASVFAMRDSEVLKLSPEAFERLVHAHPKLMEHMARLMLTRARADERAKPARRSESLRASSPPRRQSICICARACCKRALKRLGASAVIVTEEDAGALEAKA